MVNFRGGVFELMTNFRGEDSNLWPSLEGGRDSNLWPILEVGFELMVKFRGGDSN